MKLNGVEIPAGVYVRVEAYDRKHPLGGSLANEYLGDGYRIYVQDQRTTPWYAYWKDISSELEVNAANPDDLFKAALEYIFTKINAPRKT